MSERQSAEYVAVPTAWGGWIARTPEGHRFRLAAVESTHADAVRKLAEAVEAWERLASTPVASRRLEGRSMTRHIDGSLRHD